MLWLALHFPMLGLEERLDTLDGSAAEPAVLVEDNRVVQANEGAQLAEIALGSTLATANSILPALNHFNRDPAAEHERLSWLAQMAYRYTPRVSPAPPDALLLEVRGSLRLFGGAKALVDKVAADCRRCGHEQRWAVATTPLAALMLARAGMGIVVEQPVRTALNGVQLVHGDLPSRDLERLANMGITRIDELLGLPGRELGKRFGPALIDYLARLTGDKADPRAFIEPSEQFHSSVHLLEPVRGKDALLFPMRKLAAELARWLARRHFGVRVLTWTVKPLTGPEAVLTVEFANPRRDDQSFLTLSRLKLDGADMPGEVMSVSLRADFVAPFSTDLADLWGMTEHGFHARRDRFAVAPRIRCANSPGGEAALAARQQRTDLFHGRGYPSRSPAEGSATHAELVDLLAAKLGSEAVRDLRALDDHRPEYAWCTEQAGSLRAVRTSKRPAMGHFRPLWLLDPPKPVDAGLFELVSGPERIETGWWGRDRDTVGSVSGSLRDYYVAYSKHGAKCWLYREQKENWFLHGYFA